jgi:hypothetical protein
MLYQIWLRGFEVEARDSVEAVARACQKLRENPASHIAGVRRGTARRNTHGVLWRLFTGK